MIPEAKAATITPADTFMSAIEFLRAEKRQSESLGMTSRQYYEDEQEWAAKSDQERQLCYMDFAERYADYVCGYEKSHDRRALPKEAQNG